MNEYECSVSSWSVDTTVLAPVGILLLLLGAMLIFSLAILSFFYNKNFGSESYKSYENGVSALFAIRLLLMGPNFLFQSLMKITADTTRNRVYSGMRRFIFFGREIWTAGHPALCKHIFTPANAKLWRKVDKKTLNGIFFQKDLSNNSMLYTGDDEGWKHARAVWSPFFLQKDFSCYDEKIDEICDNHLVRLLKYREGRAELLELVLYITIDLLCQVLYEAVLPQDELNILVEALAEYTVIGTSHRGKYPGGLDCYGYHSKVAMAIADKAPDGCFAKIIMKDEHMSQTLRYENCAFFLEALTPAFASFWTISNIMLKSSTVRGIKEATLSDPVYREKCIKEALRMYPPVPSLWGRIANKTHTFSNPLYDEAALDERGIFTKMFSEPDIRTVESIIIKKDTMIMVIPSCLHYDDRFWMNPDEFLPSRWDKNPRVIQENTTTARKVRHSGWGALTLGKGDDIMTRLAVEKKTLKIKVSSYDMQEVPLRYKLFGAAHEHYSEIENYEQLKVATDGEDFLPWSFFPFGLGKHMCLGRRLAVKMVDGIVANLLSYDINFENGVTPSLFKKHWTDRLNAVSAVYNYPADPVYIEFGNMHGDIKRIDLMFTKDAKMKRKSMTGAMMPLASVFDTPSDEGVSKQSAVLFITCQNKFLDPNGKLYSKVEGVMEKIGTKKHLRELLKAANDNHALIIHAPVEISANGTFVANGFDEYTIANLEGMFTPGTLNTELYKGTGSSADDIVLNGRHGPDCVTGSNLLSSLQDNQIERLFVAGLLTDVTVESTVRVLSKKLKGKVTIHPVSDATASMVKNVPNECSTPVTTDAAVGMLEGNEFKRRFVTARQA